MTTATEAVVTDMPDDQYRGTDALSQSGAKLLLESPARYKWEMDHPVYKDAYDVGGAVHYKVLGAGQPVEVVDKYRSWITDAAKQMQTDIRAERRIPILAKQMASIDAMAEAVLAHPTARLILETPGQKECSLFGTGPDTGVPMRARLDHLPDAGNRRTIAADLKTAASASPREFAASAAKYGYDIQDAFYQNMIRLTRGDRETAFVFIVVEKTPPYLVSVVQLDPEFHDVGERRMRRAIQIYRHCTETGLWPGYAETIHTLGPPRWHAIQDEQDTDND